MGTTTLGTVGVSNTNTGNEIGWTDGFGGFARNLGDVATFDIFDFNNDNPMYQASTYTPQLIQPTEMQAINSPDYFAQQYSLKQSGTLRNAAFSDPAGYRDAVNSADAATQLKYLENQEALGWDAPEVTSELSNNDVAMNNLITTNADQVNANNALNADKMNSWWTQNAGTISGITSGIQGLSSIGNMYLGFKQLGLMEDQVDIAKDQWSETKKELARIKGVRSTLNAEYSGTQTA